jgi:NADH:ubiquinone oxidoreductase subunit 4 (subunit M)
MNDILQYFLLLPLLGFLISLLLPETKEKIISWTAFSTVFLQLISLVVFIIIWLFYGANDLNLKEITFLKTFCCLLVCWCVVNFNDNNI